MIWNFQIVAYLVLVISGHFGVMCRPQLFELLPSSPQNGGDDLIQLVWAQDRSDENPCIFLYSEQMVRCSMEGLMSRRLSTVEGQNFNTNPNVQWIFGESQSPLLNRQIPMFNPYVQDQISQRGKLIYLYYIPFWNFIDDFYSTNLLHTYIQAESTMVMTFLLNTSEKMVLIPTTFIRFYLRKIFVGKWLWKMSKNKIHI